MKNLFYPQFPLSRKSFTLAGLALFAVKYNIDRLIAGMCDRKWFITDYFVQPDHLAVTELSADDQEFYLLLVMASIPFILVGTVFCLKRLLDAGLPRWLVGLFFIPFVNLAFFLMLCVIPAKRTTAVPDERPDFLGRLIPKSSMGSMLFSVGITLAIGLAFTIISVNVLNEYGWGLFIGVPFFIGFSSVLLYAYHHTPVKMKTAIGIGAGAITIFAGLLFFMAMEGIICIAMAAPVAYPICIIGSLAAFAVQSYAPNASMNCVAAHVLLIPALMWAEERNDNALPVYELKTAIIVNAPPQTVWKQLIEFNTIPPPTELIFQTGIAYPTDAIIEGQGVGAVRRCNFTTGSFVEPITRWDEPTLLQFDVLEQPQPMFELSIYKEVEAVHLDGYFQSVRGQFRLVSNSDGSTYLEGTTWYKNKMWPLSYWKLWSDFILHRIHYRVLNHIKVNSEL